MKHLFIYILTLGTIFISCDSKKAVQAEYEKENINASETKINDSTKIFIDASKIDSMMLILDNDLKTVINNSDYITLADAVSTAEYDTRLNNSDIMIKMQAPDYTIIIYNTGKSNDESDWLMVWKENGRTKFKNKWYTLAEDKKADVYKLLDKYKENSN
ncbi:hypothetical protein CLV62_10845 [Dysgonomonas alginatilytica]|uniref:Lipoprotein n=1 Tax=Dysgonomonas alginatilytica TaxID=1605892 RepID=A0A2V3PSA2_9BACT|nr:hypothetical protein [Dysgonomonas alginatilytica]PXV65047.1 hypothetical protein CLV62_10845 [Dysgonomonas alginatilytica]